MVSCCVVDVGVLSVVFLWVSSSVVIVRKVLCGVLFCERMVVMKVLVRVWLVLLVLKYRDGLVVVLV